MWSASVPVVSTELGRCRRVSQGRDIALEAEWVFECPGCGTWAYLDDDQWHGRVSVDHSGEVSPTTGAICTYHETHNYAAALYQALRDVQEPKP